MDAFIRKHQGFIVSLMAALAGIAALVYSAVVTPANLMQADTAALVAIISRDNQAMAKIEEERKRPDVVDEVGIQSLPNFLKRINAIAHKTNVIVRELLPSRDANIKFNIKIVSDFYTFLRFVMQLESLNVAINDMQIRPFDNTKKPPLHAIEFSITPRRDAEPLESKRIAALSAAVDSLDRRNPFQRFAFDLSKPVVSMEIDLTWIYKLSGIGRIGDEQVATIDNKDYRKGDRIENMDITAVRSDRVELIRKTDHGSDRYVLKFRTSGIKKP